jgi:hypothetical protein
MKNQLTPDRLHRVSTIVKEYETDLLAAIKSGGDVTEHIKGHFSGLKLAILTELSDCVVEVESNSLIP